ncbi:MAG: GNAT family N-acetyltransferase [Rhodobacter sp.]|nr:GNAT family N-acetyltransferase [Rhodobacter sp.]
MTLAIRVLTGAEVETALDGLARLRIAVFREWPYLYDGDLVYERRYLARFVDSPGAVLVGAFDGDHLVGAATGSPMEDHADDFAKAFDGSGIPLSDVFYCAESVLLPAYRSRGAGHAFFEHRERQADDLGYRHVAFCAVIRADVHALKPAGYRPLEPFWHKRGYRPLDGVVARLAWKDVDQPGETGKELQFWIKSR